MARIHVYADESGNFDFSRGPGATRYFILTSVTFFDDRQARAELDELRYDVAWKDGELPDYFHASEDRQAIRDQVFDVIQRHGFRVDATIMEKGKALSHMKRSESVFYKYAWFYHLRHVLPSIANADDEVLLVIASIGKKRKRAYFRGVVSDVVDELRPSASVHTTQWSAASDSGLQIADYCSWAIFRKWENGDERSYTLIEDKIRRERDLFASGRDDSPALP